LAQCWSNIFPIYFHWLNIGNILGQYCTESTISQDHAQHFVKFPGSLNAANHAFRTSRRHFARQVQEERACEFPHALSQRVPRERNIRLHAHWRVRTGPRPLPQFPSVPRFRSELRNRITQLVRATKNSIEMLPPVIASSRADTYVGRVDSYSRINNVNSRIDNVSRKSHKNSRGYQLLLNQYRIRTYICNIL